MPVVGGQGQRSRWGALALLDRLCAGYGCFGAGVELSLAPLPRGGVGVDGGVYNDIDGASVKPGRMTSITIDLEPGRYVIYDSYKKNRSKGFRTKLIVE